MTFFFPTFLSPGDFSGGVFGLQNLKNWGPSRKTRKMGPPLAQSGLPFRSPGCWLAKGEGALVGRACIPKRACAVVTAPQSPLFAMKPKSKGSPNFAMIYFRHCLRCWVLPTSRPALVLPCVLLVPIAPVGPLGVSCALRPFRLLLFFLWS
jgi:hypothetical protein